MGQKCTPVISALVFCFLSAKVTSSSQDMAYSPDSIAFPPLILCHHLYLLPLQAEHTRRFELRAPAHLVTHQPWAKHFQILEFPRLCRQRLTVCSFTLENLGIRLVRTHSCRIDSACVDRGSSSQGHPSPS